MELIDKTVKEVEYTVKLSREEMILLLAGSYVSGDVRRECRESARLCNGTSSITPFMNEIEKPTFMRAANNVYNKLLKVLSE